VGEGRPEVAYAAALARIHEAGFASHPEAAAREVLRRLHRARLEEGLIVDLGCGSGIMAQRLSDAGYEVLGVDQSAAMLEIARSRAPRARFVRGSFVDAEIPPCVAVTAIGEVLGYAVDARAGREALRSVLARAREALVPDGLLLFDLAGPGRGPRVRPRRTWRAGDDWAVCLETTEDAASATLTRRHIFFARERDAWQREDEVHTLLLHEPREVLEDLRAAGFRARVVRRYADLRFPRGLAGFAARPGPA
jgi:SAM-dependent methyltransferase